MHTPEPWKWSESYTDRDGYTSQDLNSAEGEGVLFHCAMWPISSDNAHLIAAAPETPHECDDPTCPGAINKRKLDAFPELLYFLKLLCDLMWQATNDGNPDPIRRSFGIHMANAYIESRATIAKATA